MENYTQDSLFAKETERLVPLAERMRPTLLSEFIGQKHIIGDNSLLSRSIIADRVSSCIFWGAPGTGKTTLANIISNATSGNFVKLNAVSSGVADAKKVIEDATVQFRRYGKRTYLMLDECHRWSKAQSDCVLQAIETGIIIFIGSTTENPYVSMTRAIVSRCSVYEFKPIDFNDVCDALHKAIISPKGLKSLKINISNDAIETLAELSGGDLRTAYNAIELASLSTKPDQNGIINIDKVTAEQSVQRKAIAIDKQQYYDTISAFIKSMRGSDSSAAMFWFCKLINAGCDPMLLARRIVICASEDVGLADPLALVVATSAMIALQNVGLPEARLNLTQAILYICNAEKSNSAEVSLCKATELAEKYPNAQVPSHLMDTNFSRSSDFKFGEYKYPHNYGGYVEQQYLPNELIDEVIYRPTGNGKDINKKLNERGSNK